MSKYIYALCNDMFFYSNIYVEVKHTHVVEKL